MNRHPHADDPAIARSADNAYAFAVAEARAKDAGWLVAAGLTLWAVTPGGNHVILADLGTAL